MKAVNGFNQAPMAFKKIKLNKKQTKSRPFRDLFMISALANSKERPSESRAIKIHEDAEEGLKYHQEKYNQKYKLHAVLT